VSEVDKLLRLAIAKLCAASDPSNETVKMWREAEMRGVIPPKTKLQFLALLSPRLALTIGSSTAEATELVAGHLAVLTRTDRDRQFLRTVYASEPVLAEVSARQTTEKGWGSPLRCLNHFIQTGIVSAGFRGELLTKILCLMSMDRALASIPCDISKHWRCSRPISTRDFLDSLVAPLVPGGKFSDSLTAEFLNVDADRLDRFLDGWVFFTHFVLLASDLSYPKVVKAWNRGAALVCKPVCEGADFLIPVLQKSKEFIEFGPLYGQWSPQQVEVARKNVAFITINSKNYSNEATYDPMVWSCRLSPENMMDYEDSGIMFLSMLHAFGPKQVSKPRVHVKPCTTLIHQRSPNKSQQFAVILHGLDENVYGCLRDYPPQYASQNEDLQHVREYLDEIRTEKVQYVDKNGDDQYKLAVYQSLPTVFSDDMDWSDNWNAERNRVDGIMPMDKNLSEMLMADISQPVNIDPMEVD